MDSRMKYMLADELAKVAEELVVAGRPRMKRDEFIERAREVHGPDAYDYSKVDMNHRDEKGRVLIKCNKCGQEFWQRPDKHLDGNGCMNCYVVESNGAVPGQPNPDEPPAQAPAQPAQQPAAPVQKPQPKPQPAPQPKPQAQPAPKPVPQPAPAKPAPQAVKPEQVVKKKVNPEDAML